MSIFEVSERKLGSELWAMKEKVSDPYPPSPTRPAQSTGESLTGVSTDSHRWLTHVSNDAKLSQEHTGQASSNIMRRLLKRSFRSSNSWNVSFV